MAHSLPALLSRVIDTGHENPDFSLSSEQIALEWERMRATPKSPVRPIVCMSGYRSWHWFISAMWWRMGQLVGGPREMWMPISYPLRGDIHACAAKVTRLVHRRWGADREVDVIGISMGGLVARTAALPGEQGGHGLRIARLFTLATPHNGAKLAEMVGVLRPDRAARCMRPGSEYLAKLNAALQDAPYELTCYARTNDTWVGATRTAPPGREPLWVGGTRLLSHITITNDRRIVTDIARRLRGETPLATRGSRPPVD